MNNSKIRRTTKERLCIYFRRNNDEILNKITRLNLELNRKVLANKRVNNYLKLLNQTEADVVKMLLIDKCSKTVTVKTLDRTARQIERILARALKKIASIHG